MRAADAGFGRVKRFILMADTLHIWRIPLAQAEALEPHTRRVLSADETDRALRFRFPRDRAAFTCARAALRGVLGRYLALSPEEIRFGYGRNGKPYLAAPHGDPPLAFNLSHTQGLSLVGVTRGVDIGIDVELIRSVPERAAIASSHFSEEERALFGPDQSDRSFFACWTRKEALLKGVAIGLLRPLHTLGIVPEPDRSDWFRIVGELEGADRWRVHTFFPAPEYVAGVAAAMEGGDPDYFEWDWGHYGSQEDKC